MLDSLESNDDTGRDDDSDDVIAGISTARITRPVGSPRPPIAAVCGMRTRSSRHRHDGTPSNGRASGSGSTSQRVVAAVRHRRSACGRNRMMVIGG